MPTYYVANYGSNTNNGTTPATPWATIQFALGAASGTNPGLVAGDTVWIAPGTYREVITSTTLTGSSGNTINIYGDPTFTKAWSTGSAGRVRLTNYTTDTATPVASQTLAVIGDYINIQDLCLDGFTSGTLVGNVVTEACLFLRGGNISVTRCVVQCTSSQRALGIEYYCPTGKNNCTLDRCTVFSSFGIWMYSATQTATYDINGTVKDCCVISTGSDFGIAFQGEIANQVTGARIYNNTVTSPTGAIYFSNFSQVGGTTTVVRNNVIYALRTSGVQSASGTITITQSNNTIYAGTTFSNVLPATNNIYASTLDFGASRVQGFSTLPWFAPMVGSPLIGAGSATGAPTVDLYGNTWTSTPTIGPG